MSFRAFAFAAALAVLAFAGGCSRNVVYKGPPAFEVGTGDGDFEPLGPGATVPINYGPQGGEHIWFAARCRGVGAKVALTYGIVDDQGNVVSSEQNTAIPDDDTDDEGWRIVSSLTAFVDTYVVEGTRVVFRGHIEDDEGHALDATAETVVEGSIEE